MIARSQVIGRLIEFIIIACALWVLYWLWSGYLPSQGNTNFSSENGSDLVRNRFNNYFYAKGGIEIFGYPLTEPHYVTATGIYVQYFERFRMEYRSSESIITLGNVVEEMGYGQPPLNQIPPDTPYQRYFPSTGHSTAYAFLAFFNTHGGEEIFGYPISEPLLEDGRLVQYFQRTRMEWWPELPPENRVRLSRLEDLNGLDIIPVEWLNYDAQLIELSIDNDSLPPYIGLDIHIASKELYTQTTYLQSLVISVTDTYNRPAIDATVQIVTRSRFRLHSYPALKTNSKGLVNIELPFPLMISDSTAIHVVAVSADGRLRGMMTWPKKFLPLPQDQGAISAISVTASVSDAMVRQGGTQTVYILVTDQNGNPVEGAQVSVTAYFSLSIHAYSPVFTSQHGIASYKFEIEPKNPGETVQIEVLVELNENSNVLTANTTTSFIVWDEP